MKFRTNPILVEAVQLLTGNAEVVEEFCGGDLEVRSDHILIATPRGPLRAQPFDWIVKHGINRFAVVPNDLFRGVFARVDD